MSTLQNTFISGDSKKRRWKISPLLTAWIVIGLVASVDFAGLHLLNRSVVVGRMVHLAPGFLVIAAVIAWINFRTKFVGNAETKWTFRLLDLANTGRWMLALAAFCMAADILSRLSVAANYPLIDEQLSKIDEAIGFDWVGWYHWVRLHPALLFLLNLTYGSSLLQTVAVPVILGMSGRRLELSNHVTRFMLAILICLLVATFFPAASAFLHFHISEPGTSSTVSTFLPLRDGTLRVFDLADQQGLVSMPSMHTTMAILFAYAVRRVPVLGYAMIFVNAVMIASTPTQGGHYLSDVVAGLLLAAITIMLVRWMCGYDSPDVPSETT